MNIPITVDTSSGDTTAKLKQQTVAMATKVMIDGERILFFGDLVEMRMDTKEVDTFIANQEYSRHGDVRWLGECEMKLMIERERTMVTDAMKNKLIDRVAVCVKKEMELQILKKRL